MMHQLELLYPGIPWREPMPMRLIGMSGPQRYACRFCLALYGVKDESIKSMPTDPEVVRRHIREEH